MIVPDVNLLLYACMAGFEEHEAARAWLEGLMNGVEEVGLALPAVFGFIGLGTNPRVFDPPLSADDAIDRVQGWLARPQVQVLLPGPRHLELCFSLFTRLGTAANLTTDVQLAALAMEHQATLHSNDGDFGRMEGLRWVNPLAVAAPKKSRRPPRSPAR